MDEILQSISRDDTQALKEILHRRMVLNTKGKDKEITTDDLQDLFLHASFIGARKCLEHLSEYGAYKVSLFRQCCFRIDVDS